MMTKPAKLAVRADLISPKKYPNISGIPTANPARKGICQLLGEGFSLKKERNSCLIYSAFKITFLLSFRQLLDSFFTLAKLPHNC